MIAERARGQVNQASSAFCVCSRFSAWSKTIDRGEPMTSSATSAPRAAGRQCMNAARGARASSAPFTW